VGLLRQFKEYLERAEYIKKEFIDAQTEVSATANGAAAQKPKAGGKDDVSSSYTLRGKNICRRTY
jgi:hypothetical protein